MACTGSRISAGAALLALLATLPSCRKSEPPVVEFRNPQYYVMSIYEDQRAVVVLCARCRKEVPKGADACASCSEKISAPSVPCGYCNGTGSCPTCAKFGTEGKCRFCKDWDPASRRACTNCKGSATCHVCQGSLKDTFCSGTGKIPLKSQ